MRAHEVADPDLFTEDLPTTLATSPPGRVSKRSSLHVRPKIDKVCSGLGQTNLNRIRLNSDLFSMREPVLDLQNTKTNRHHEATPQQAVRDGHWGCVAGNHANHCTSTL